MPVARASLFFPGCWQEASVPHHVGRPTKLFECPHEVLEEKEAELEIECDSSGEGSVPGLVVRDLQGVNEVRDGNIWWKDILGRGNSQCKGSEVGT